jgi:integrase
MVDGEPEPLGLGPESVGQAEASAPSQELAERTLMSFQAAPTTVGEVLNRSPRCANLLKDHPVRASITRHFGIQELEPLQIDLLYTQRSLFTTALKHQRVSKKQRTRFRYAIQILLNEATGLGWNADDILSEEWKSILKDARLNRCANLVMYFAGIGVQPGKLVRSQIDDWINGRVIAQERTFSSAWQAAYKFTNLMLGKDYSNVDFIAAARFDDYAIPLKEFLPPDLKKQVQRLLTFRKNRRDGSRDEPEDEDELSDADNGNDIHDPTKLKRRQVREITARTLECSICCLYGFLKKQNRDVQCLDQLFEEVHFNDYQRWLLKVRETPPTALRSRFQPLLAAVNQYPALEGRRNFLRKFMTQIKNEPDWKRRRRMAEKCISHEDLENIPGKLRSEREALVETATKCEDKSYELAVLRLATEELLIRWLLVLPWRARNICGCRLGSNIKNDLIGPNSMLLKGLRMKEIQKSKQKFWQYSFTKEECKGNSAIDGLLPSELIGPLEDYLDIRGVDADDLTGQPPLFINAKGSPMGHTELYCIICGLTLRFGRKRASTKVLRDMFASRYLQEHKGPTRFDDLAKILWHSDPAITRKYYATQRDLRCGARIADEYLRGRRLSPLSGLALPDSVLFWVCCGMAVCIVVFAVLYFLFLCMTSF